MTHHVPACAFGIVPNPHSTPAAQRKRAVRFWPVIDKNEVDLNTLSIMQGAG